MKKTILLSAIAAFALTFNVSASLVTLTDFGTTAFTVEESLTNVDFSQTSSTSSITSGDAGGIFAGLVTTPFNLSSSDPIVLVFSYSGTNRNTPFELVFFTPTFTQIGTYSGVTTAAAVPSTPTSLALSTSNTFSNSSVGAIQLTFNGEGSSINYTLHSVSVPEPSTYALLALGGLALFFVARRRKLKA